MTVVAGRPAAISAETNAAVVIFRFLASLKLAVALIATLAVVLAVATIVETERGRDYAQWYVYHSSWFVALLGLLGVNILAATLVRFPWKKKRGFLITHVGLLVLLAGAILTFLRGIDAQLFFEEGETTRRIVFNDHCQFTARWQDSAGKPTSTEAVFNFQPGPRDWSDGQTRDLGPCEGVQLKVLKFYSHARADETWLDDVTQQGGPALRFAFSGPDGTVISEDWLVAEQFGAQAAIGPAQLELQQIREPALLEDFLHPPTGDAGKQGLLSAHYEGKTVRIPVGANLGKKVPVGESGAAVELVQYLANAKPGPGGRFVAGGEEPINPFLELRVHLPGVKEPVRQIAFANLPFLNLDAVHGRVCPVKFWYHHPAVTAPPGAEFLQTPDGKLYCRIGAGGKYQSRGVVKEGDQIQLAGRFKLTLARYLPHARQQVSFQPLQLASGESGGPEAAALVEVAAGGRTQQVWLKRNDPTYGTRIIATDQATLTLGFGSEFQPLDFSLKLVKFKHGLNPGGMGDASFASSVQVIDPKFHVDQTREISMNEPLTYGGLTFYQSGFYPSEGRDGSILSVAYDPGLTAKYLGCAMICLGTFIMFFLRISLWKQIFAWFGPPPPDRDSSTRPPAHKERRMSTSTVALGTLLILAGTAQAGNPAAEPVDWLTWRHLPVLDGGRQKPLDSLAWETFRMIGNRASFVHPKTGDQLDATEAYLAMLLEWQGWDQPAPPMIDDSNPHAAYFTSHQPDGWDKMPLLLVDSAGLRQALGMPEHERFISPLELSHAKIVLESPSHGQSQDRDGDVARTPSAEATDSHRSGAQTTTPFLPWVQKVRAKQKGFSPQEKVAIELAERLWTYESTRMGLRLQLVPVEGSAQQQWASLADLFRAKLDDAQDPSGGLRKLQAQFQLLRKAYRGGDVPAFNAATADFLGTVRTIGPKLGAYPRQSDIDLEVSYNHWVPFRFAWVFTILACALGLLARGSRWRPLYAAALAAYGAAIVAMGIGFAMRVAISGRAPVTNMYESIIYVGLGVSLFGLLFELIYRKQFILIAAAAVATVALVLADNCPAVLDPSLQPLQPVLRSNYWLVIHVMTITLSYAAFALALGIADVTLGFYLFGAATRRESIAGLSQFNYKALQIGVLLLAAGVITGGIWAAYSWGRFWGWDPKEVWALIALLCYLAVLHARFARWIGDLGLAAWSVACFSAVVMAWYGVNFVLGSGLHSYGSGGGGKVYVLSAVLLQLLYVMAAVSMADRTPAKADAEDGPAGPKSTGGFRDLQAVSAADDVAP